MQFRAAVVIAAAFLCGCASRPLIVEPPPVPSSDVQIRSTLAALNSSCAARDLNAFMELFDESDEVLFVGSDKGEVFRGRQAIRDFMGMLYRLPFVFSFDLNNAMVHREGDYAWVFVDGNMMRTGDRGDASGKVGKGPYRFSITMVRRAGVWKWQLFNGSIPRGE